MEYHPPHRGGKKNPQHMQHLQPRKTRNYIPYNFLTDGSKSFCKEVSIFIN